MSGPPYDARAALRGFASLWNGFFYSPVDPRVCAGIRIGYALTVLMNLIAWHGDLARWFTDAGVLPRDVVYLMQARERWSLFTWLPEGETTVQIAFWLFALHAVLLLLGIASRLNALCVLVWLISFQHRNMIILDSEDTVLRLIGWYVLLMPLDRAWSLSQLRRSPTMQDTLTSLPAPGVRLLQVQMTVIFLTAAWFKLCGDPWRDGIALFFVARLDDYFGRTPLPNWIFETPWLVGMLTWSVIGVEILVPLGVWFKQTRRWALALALVFHLGNELTMHLFLFHWLMLIGWSAFLLPVESKEVESTTAGASAAPPH